jgi:hypothetical protein
MPGGGGARGWGEGDEGQLERRLGSFGFGWEMALLRLPSTTPPIPYLHIP